MPTRPQIARGFGVEALLATLTVVLSTLVLITLREILSLSLVALLYLFPVGLSSTRWGLGGGIAASLCAFIAFNYFFIPPYYTLQVHQLQDLLVVFVFLGVAIFVSQIVGQAKNNLNAAQAREQEAVALYELNATLARLRSREEIIKALGQRLHLALNATQTEIVLLAEEGAEVVYQFRLPENTPPITSSPQLVSPMLTARGQLGEIRVWRIPLPLLEREKRLLWAFTSQGTLALEYTFLDQVELRAKVLEEGDRLKSALLSSVSHELRTPLASIKAAVTSLRSGEVAWATNARTDLLTMVEEETDHLNRLVGNLLAMSRIEAGVLEPKRQWNLLSDVLDETLARLKRTVAPETFIVEMPSDLPLLPIDPVLLDQVFTNLISNAVKYAPPHTPITISAFQVDEAKVQVQVRNHGPHVPAEHVERIFEKFYRARDAERVTGTGLGLSICKGFVEAHGGQIWAENLKDGFGFSFTLPSVWPGHSPVTLLPEVDG